MNKTPDSGASQTTLPEAERIARLRLIRSQNVGPVTFRELLERFGDARRALDALPDLARRGGRARPISICSKAAAAREFEQTRETAVEIVVFGDDAYPRSLAATEDAPGVLLIKGHRHLLAAPTVAIVGARNASAVGVRFAREIAAELGGRGLTVVSGMARGIDSAAHEGSLATGTLAVMAGGIDIVYPAENQDLYDRIAETGLLISEMPLGIPPQARHFPRRNRIISGLALGVLVVEAAPRSGSLITARLAGEQGREVFAVPGSPLDPRSRGANNLIRQGAVLTETADDIMNVLDEIMRRPLGEPDQGRVPGPVPAPPGDDELDSARRVVHQKLSPAPISVDELVRQCHLTPGAVLTILLELELAGGLQRHPGNQVSLV